MTNRSFLDGLVEDLVKAKHISYSQECIYQDKLNFEDLNHLYNGRGQRLKTSLITHKISQKYSNSKCIIYLHGLGSSRLQALTVAKSMPQQYCLCTFDLSGSGKSGGDYLTYGIKQQEDIEFVLKHLRQIKYIKQFILWGRSMGAVAVLLYASQSLKIKPQRRNIFQSYNQSKRKQETLVTSIVLDSPFHNFRSIARQIAIKKLSVPSMITDIALNYLQSSFQRIFQVLGENYNPFSICFQKQINLQVPILFLYSQKDQIVPSSQSQNIIKNVKSSFQRIFINQCSHNQARPPHLLAQVFMKLNNYARRKLHRQKTLQKSVRSIEKDLSYSCSGMKQGIFVYTTSKQKQKRAIQNDKNLNKMKQTIDFTTMKSSIFSKNMHSSTTSIGRSPIQLKNRKPLSSLIIYDQTNPKIQTIDIQTSKLITQKLLENTSSNYSRLLRPKRHTLGKKDVKLTHHKYLE